MPAKQDSVPSRDAFCFYYYYFFFLTSTPIIFSFLFFVKQLCYFKGDYLLLLLVPPIEFKGGDWLKFGGNNVDLGRKYMRVE